MNSNYKSDNIITVGKKYNSQNIDKNKNNNDATKINNTHNQGRHHRIDEIDHHVRTLISLISVVAAAYVKCISSTPHSLAVSMSKVSNTLLRFVQYWRHTLFSLTMHGATVTTSTQPSTILLTSSAAIRTSIYLIQNVNPAIANEVYFTMMQN